MRRLARLVGKACGVTRDNSADGPPPSTNLPAASTLVALRASGSKTPVVIVVGSARRGVEKYEAFVSHLRRDRPVFALQAPRTADGLVPRAEIEDIAASYAHHLARFLHDSPCVILGYCFDGLVAYETARQLNELDRSPAPLVIIDSCYGQRASRREVERVKFADFKQRDLRGKARWVKRRAAGLAYKIRIKCGWSAYKTLVALGLPVPRWLAVPKRSPARSTSRRGGLQPSAISATFIHCSQPGLDWDPPTAFWKRLTGGGLEIRVMAMDGMRHDNLLSEPYVGTVARHVDEVLARLDPEPVAPLSANEAPLAVATQP